MKKMFIIRGLPGAGKSTKTNEILTAYNRIDYKVCSADHYFNRPDGTYDWNPRLLKQAHFWCYNNAKEACEDRVEMIIIDNTNIKRRDFQSYLDLAQEFKYEVEEIVVGKFDEESCRVYAERNIHGCPLETILKRAKDWEP